MTIGTPIDIHDIPANFGGRSRGGCGGGQIFPFPIGLSGRPYDILACVIYV